MTINEAVLRSLEEMQRVANPQEVCQDIVLKKYYDFANARTPANTVSAQLGNFIRNGDSRVKRIKKANGTYYYYLAKFEESIGDEILETTAGSENFIAEVSLTYNRKTFHERDLHKLLCSYLKNVSIASKTVFHEKSTFEKDQTHVWTHPDMVGVKLLKLKMEESQNLLKAINKTEIFQLSSYEVKKEINTDAELKKAFFQAVSNSSWANFGYLVAFEFNDNLMEEMERLSQSFGIGIIELDSNPYRSKVLFAARHRNLDFSTIDKLCRINKEFKEFVGFVEKLMAADSRYWSGVESELETFCDRHFKDDSEVREYCRNRGIPIEEEMAVTP